ncbi:MAG: cation:dicarboxylase symporter family transporter [Peptostreptococcaceae bacterium]
MNSFLSEFLMISDFKTVLFILVLFGTFSVVKQMESKKVKFSTRTILATLMGLFVGVVIQFVAGFPENPSEVTWLTEVSKWYGLFGYGFMDLLKMLVVPLVFTSILRVIINMNDDNLGALTGKTIGMLLITTALSAAVGIILGNVMKLGVGTDISMIETDSALKEITPIVDTLRGLLPENPVMSMAEGAVVPVVIFAAFLGLATKRQTKKYFDVVKPFIDLVEAFYKIILSVAMTVIKFMPYAVVALLANTITGRGISSIFSVIQFIIAIYIGVAIMFVIHLGILSLVGINPINYVKNATEPLLLAFTSRSSLGTLPVTIDTLTNKQKLDEGTASFVASLAANMGMNACAGLYPALMAVTIANMAGIEQTASFYAMLIVVITVGSLGIAGLPGTATMAVSVVLSGVGLGAYFPLAGGIVAIDPILDMGRTMLNVNGGMTTAMVVGKSLGKLDETKETENK